MFPHTQPIKTDHLKLNKTFNSSKNKPNILNNVNKLESKSSHENKKALCPWPRTRGGGPIAVGLEPICRQSKGHSVPAHGTWGWLWRNWLHALDSSLVEESSQHGQPCLPGSVISDMFSLRELLSRSCLWSSFSFLTSAFELQHFDLWLCEICGLAHNSSEFCHSNYWENMGELRVYTAQFIPRRNFSLGRHSMGKPEYHKNKPCTPDLILKVTVK